MNNMMDDVGVPEERNVNNPGCNPGMRVRRVAPPPRGGGMLEHRPKTFFS